MSFTILLLIFLAGTGNSYDIFPKNHEFVYKINGQILLVPDAEREQPNMSNDNTMWAMVGNLIIQNKQVGFLSVRIELDPGYHPAEPAVNVLMEQFHVKIQDDTVKKIFFHKDELPWSQNIKRSIASLLILHGNGVGAFVDENDRGLFGKCKSEYFVVNNEGNLLITKNYNMDDCVPFFGYVRSNLPHNYCQQEKQTQVITSRIATYNIEKIESKNKYLLKEIDSTMRTNVQTFESYYPQFLFSQIVIKYVSHKPLQSKNDTVNVEHNTNYEESGLQFVFPEEATGGRKIQTPEQLVKKTADLLDQLADSLEAAKLDFNEPYDGKVSEIIRIMETMDLNALKMLFAEIDIGTSYRQETSRNLFLEIIPRAGTPATVLFTRDLVINWQVRSTIAVQLLMALPFYIAEPTQELIKECEGFLNLGTERPDVKHVAVLGYATMIYKTFVVGKMPLDVFEKYVKMYFDLFLNSFEYEEQMLYIQALGNLQLGNVAEYLEPIIVADYPQTTDIRFLAIWATMPTAHLRPEKVFEIYWPIFYSKSTPLQLRVAAFTMLLLSNPTPGRLLGLYEVVKNEKCPHLINFYYTTIMSISETTYSCYRHLQRLLSYMTRTLPKKPAKKFWTTGNYIFDYRDRKFHIGAILQTLLIGEQMTDLPMVCYIKFDTEALGKFTGQLGLYIKARGLTNAVIERIAKYNADNLKMADLAEVLSQMKLPKKSADPLHLEFILQVEGKAVVSYFLNQTTFQNLTDGDLINRINLLLRSDSHINMQILRRPFMIKYSLPTLLGTPTSILIESTVIGTLRGNTTQNMAADKISRNNQIDLRYSSYAVAKLSSYNPIEDIEYSTIREQGFLIYFPVHNEVMVNITAKSLVFGFFRPENLTSGVSLKSRTRNQPDLGGLWSMSPQQDKNIQSYKYHLEDIGLDVLLGINEEYATENFLFMLEADILNNIKVFSKSPFSFVHEILTLISLIQLNSIHIGRDKHMTLLVNNPQKTKIDGIIRMQSEDLTQTASSKENQIYKIDCSLSHKTDTAQTEGKTLYKWDLMMKYTTYKNSSTSKIMISFGRKPTNGPKWKICISESHDSFGFLKRPFASSSATIVFGELVAAQRNCPNDKSRIDINLSYKLPRDVASLYLDYKSMNEDVCPKEIIMLTPPPFTNMCRHDEFQEITRISNFDARFKFEKMPDWFKNVANRIDHAISAVLPPQVDRLNISNDFKISLEKTTKDSDIAVSINGNHFTIPITFDFDSKLSTQRQLAIEYGFINLCSLIGIQINTFYDLQAELTNEIVADFTYETRILLAADCTQHPKFALFVDFFKTPHKNKGQLKEVRIYTGGNYFTYDVEKKKVLVNGQEEVNISKEASYTYPPYEQFYDYKIQINDDEIFVYENSLIGIEVQFNLEKILSIQVPTYHKNKMCGVCALNNNLDLKYTMN